MDEDKFMGWMLVCFGVIASAIAAIIAVGGMCACRLLIGWAFG